RSADSISVSRNENMTSRNTISRNDLMPSAASIDEDSKNRRTSSITNTSRYKPYNGFDTSLPVAVCSGLATFHPKNMESDNHPVMGNLATINGFDKVFTKSRTLLD
ncbi:hypothetical protein Tco_0188044, partial [Tanacetum coccineum]